MSRESARKWYEANRARRREDGRAWRASFPKGPAAVPGDTESDFQAQAVSGCPECGQEEHQAWCSVPVIRRREKRARWRVNSRARKSELQRLIREQAADMRRGKWVDRQRFNRVRTASLDEIIGEEGFETFPHRTWREMIQYA